MKKIAFITPSDAGFGFSLTGVPQYITDAGELEATFRIVTADQDAGLIIVDERLIGRLQEDRLRELDHGWGGVLLILPSPEKPPEEVEDYAARLIRRAIGYHVRLKL